jgi:hypothetical protein
VNVVSVPHSADAAPNKMTPSIKTPIVNETAKLMALI